MCCKGLCHSGDASCLGSYRVTVRYDACAKVQLSAILRRASKYAHYGVWPSFVGECEETQFCRIPFNLVPSSAPRDKAIVRVPEIFHILYFRSFPSEYTCISSPSLLFLFSNDIGFEAYMDMLLITNPSDVSLWVVTVQLEWPSYWILMNIP